MQNRFFQPAAYKSFQDYVDVTPLDVANYAGRTARYIAKEKTISRKDNPVYVDNKWFILLRFGLYRAEVEKAMSEIYQYFLGYSTDIDILKNKRSFYAVSRAINAYNDWDECGQNVSVLDGDRVVYADGKPVVGLAKICVLTNFFGEADANSGNFGLQYFEDGYRAFKIDNEYGLCFDSDTSAINLEIKLNDEVPGLAESASFISEKNAMLTAIAETDFSIIENCLRKNITSSEVESAIWMMKKSSNNMTQ